MNLTKLFTERLEQQLDGVDAKCTIPRVLPGLLAEAEAAAEAAGNAFIDGITQKRAIRAFTDSYKVNQPKLPSKNPDASGLKHEGGQGRSPSVTSGNRQCETPL